MHDLISVILGQLSNSSSMVGAFVVVFQRLGIHIIDLLWQGWVRGLQMYHPSYSSDGGDG